MDTHWIEVSKANRQARAMADRHYSFPANGKPMSHEIGPPGQKIVLLTTDNKALWGSHRPAPWAGLRRADGFEGACCFIFRNEGYPDALSSQLIQEAVVVTAKKWGVEPFLTYVACSRVQSENPGYCYLVAGFESVGYVHSAKLGRLRKLVMSEEKVVELLLASYGIE